MIFSLEESFFIRPDCRTLESDESLCMKRIFILVYSRQLAREDLKSAIFNLS